MRVAQQKAIDSSDEMAQLIESFQKVNKKIEELIGRTRKLKEFVENATAVARAIGTLISESFDLLT